MNPPRTYPPPYPSAPDLVDRIGRELRASLGWTISQPNGEPLWRVVRREAEELLHSFWRDGELVGTTASEAFFVRCDPTTMTEEDIDRGRLVLVAGVAPIRPAEFEPIQIDRKVGEPLRRSPREE